MLESLLNEPMLACLLITSQNRGPGLAHVGVCCVSVALSTIPQAFYQRLSSLHSTLVHDISKAKSLVEQENLEGVVSGIVNAEGTLLDSVNLAAIDALSDAILKSDLTLVSSELQGQLAQTVVKATSAMFALQKESGPPPQHHTVLKDCKILENHDAMQETMTEVASFPSIAAFVLADKKDDSCVRRLLSQWRSCNAVSVSYPQLRPLRDSAWEQLSEIVAERQKAVDAMMLSELATLKPHRLGGAEGASWKAGLPADGSASWDALVDAARTHLFVGDFGKQLQGYVKKLYQALGNRVWASYRWTLSNSKYP